MPGARTATALLPLLVAAVLAGAIPAPASLQPAGFLPVGAKYRPPADPGARRRDLEDMRQLRFNVVEVVDGTRPPGTLTYVERLLAAAPYPDVIGFDGRDVATVAVAGSAADVGVRAWTALARGARAIVFDDWAALGRSPEALGAAAAFADAIARNASLYAAVRLPDRARGRNGVTVAGADVEAALLESSDALVLVAVNQSAEPRSATFTFSPDVPEAIWRNMLTGASVNFVTRASGPTYSRAFGPKEVLVLAIGRAVR